LGKEKSLFLEMKVPNVLCDFGCGRAAIRQLKNGRFLCAEFSAQCPALRAKNSAANKGKNPFANRPHPRGMAGKPAWNRGLTWAQMYSPEVVQWQRVRSSAAAARMHEAMRNSPERERIRRAKLSRLALQRGLGGYERGSGRGKKGWCRGYWCDSTYELAFVVWALDHEIPFARNLELFPYEYKGRVLHWTPDFLLADGTFVEIKGYITDQTRAKFEYFLPPLRIFTRPDLERMFNHVHGQYGKNLLALYE
jgi:hypothetical protein